MSVAGSSSATCLLHRHAASSSNGSQLIVIPASVLLPGLDIETRKKSRWKNAVTDTAASHEREVWLRSFRQMFEDLEVA